MGIVKLFSNGWNTKKESREEYEKNKIVLAQKYFSRVLRNYSKLRFKFLHVSPNNKSLFYQSNFNGGTISVELDINMSSKDIEHVVDDIYKEIEFIDSQFERYYGSEFHFVSYTYTSGKNREVVFNALGEDKVISYGDDMIQMSENVRALISEECTSFDGVLTGRNENFLIDEEYDLVAFLLRNKGKRIKVELVD